MDRRQAGERGWKIVLGRRKNTCQGQEGERRPSRAGGYENPSCVGLGGRALASPWGSLSLIRVSWSPVRWCPGLEIVWKVPDLVSGVMEDHKHKRYRRWFVFEKGYFISA